MKNLLLVFVFLFGLGMNCELGWGGQQPESTQAAPAAEGEEALSEEMKTCLDALQTVGSPISSEVACAGFTQEQIQAALSQAQQGGGGDGGGRSRSKSAESDQTVETSSDEESPKKSEPSKAPTKTLPQLKGESLTI